MIIFVKVFVTHGELNNEINASTRVIWRPEACTHLVYVCAHVFPTPLSKLKFSHAHTRPAGPRRAAGAAAYAAQPPTRWPCGPLSQWRRGVAARDTGQHMLILQCRGCGINERRRGHQQ